MDPRTRNTIMATIALTMSIVVTGVLLSLAGVIYNPNPPSTLVAIAAAFVIGGMLVIATLVRARVVLERDTIEIRRNLWSSRRIERATIVGRRFHGAGWRSSQYHILVTDRSEEVKLPPDLEHSPSLQAWLSTIPLMSKRVR